MQIRTDVVVDNVCVNQEMLWIVDSELNKFFNTIWRHPTNIVVYSHIYDFWVTTKSHKMPNASRTIYSATWQWNYAKFITVLICELVHEFQIG